jgi:hypothetical protein
VHGSVKRDAEESVCPPLTIPLVVNNQLAKIIQAQRVRPIRIDQSEQLAAL